MDYLFFRQWPFSMEDDPLKINSRAAILKTHDPIFNDFSSNRRFDLVNIINRKKNNQQWKLTL